MTPAARFAAAIEILDGVSEGKALEPALLAWTRSHRFAGSKDRAALRDIVFSIYRRRASCAAMGNGLDGMALVRGYLAQEGVNESEVFGSGGYAPPAIGADDPLTIAWEALSNTIKADLQPWVWRKFQAEYGEEAHALADALRHRAPVWVRVNPKKANPKAVMADLEERGFSPAPHATCKTALRLGANERKIGQDPAYLEGLIELQDLAPQAAVEALDLEPGNTVLDYCAGGGGKSLAMAALGASVTAHDSELGRMKDIPARAARAGVKIEQVSELERQKYDLVLCDVPCSGSGAWRRATANKWSLTEADLSELVARQREIVRHALAHVKSGGRLAYMTCSLLAEENREQTSWLSDKLQLLQEQQWTPLLGADGFYLATFRKS